MIDILKTLELARRKKYEKAIKNIIDLKLNAFSLLDDIEVFGNVYNKIPMVSAVMALGVEKHKKPIDIIEKIIEIIDNFLEPANLNIHNLFDVKFSTPSGCEDLLSFLLTHDNTLKSKNYDEDVDLYLLNFLSKLLSKYQLNNVNGLIKYIFNNDLVMSLKFLTENCMYTPIMDDIVMHNIKNTSNIGQFLLFNAPHKFRFHAPEVFYSSNGKFSGGNLYTILKNIGYDISKQNSEQLIHTSSVWLIRDLIQNAFINYKRNGEVFSNESDINLYNGSEFEDATNLLLELCAEYYKHVTSYEYRNMQDDDKRRYIKKVVDSIVKYFAKLENGINTVLVNIGFPKIKLTMNNILNDNDSKMLMAIVPFMKELRQSLKNSKSKYA